MTDFLMTLLLGYALLNYLGIVVGLAELLGKDHFPLMDEMIEEGFMVKHIFFILIFLPCFIIVAALFVVVGLLTFVFTFIIPIEKIHKLMNTRLFAKKERN